MSDAEFADLFATVMAVAFVLAAFGVWHSTRDD